MARIGRLVPSLIAVYELRYLLASIGTALAGTERAYAPSVKPWVTTLAALAAASLLLEVSRGLPEHVGRPRWSMSLLGRWLLCCSALAGLIGCQTLIAGLLHTGHPAGLVTLFGGGQWSSICSAVAIGLVLAASVGGARWVLRTVARWRRRELPPQRRGVPPQRLASRLRVPTPAPLLAGWSGRGPPAVLAPAAA